jgi:arylsulfatase A-like enzyme/Tfp pilus assembly protein PilF
MITRELRYTTLRALLLLLCGAGLHVACAGDSADTDAPSSAETGVEQGEGAARSGDPASDASRSDGGPSRPYNLLLVTLDTLRADHLPAYGYDGVATPFIDRLAREGVRFERVTTTVPVTLPAHASIMTGTNPFTHGVRNNGAFVLADGATTLAEVLQGGGYATGGFIGAVVLESPFGIAQGFDTYDGLAQYQAASGDESGERPGEEVVARAGGWIRAQQQPFFAWVHMYDPHDPYEPPEPYASRYPGSPYDGEIAYVDEMVGRLLQALEEAGAADNTLVVVTADHGEGLGDHGEQGHAFFVYDSTVRVPLILWGPGVVPAGVVPTAPASVVDIFPTVLSLLGLPAAPVDGEDLGDRFRNPAAGGGAAYAESLIPFLDFGWSELRALVAGDYKYIEAPEPELYNLTRDPGETDNLVDTEIERADAMAETLAELVAGDDVTQATGGSVDEDGLAALQALGYIGGGGGGTRVRRDIDPKDMIRTYETFVSGLLETSDALEDGRFGDANDALVRLDELVPDQYIVYYYFGRLAYEAGDPQTSVEVLEHALELNPSYLPTYSQLANALHAAGDASGALALLEQAGAMFPGNFTLTLLRGAIAHDTGDLEAALVAYRAASALQPDHPELLERQGHLFLLRQQPAEAVAALRRLVQVTPERAAAWAQLALAQAQAGETAPAQRSLARAIEIDANDPIVLQVAQLMR